MRGAFLVCARILRRRRKGLQARSECDEPRGQIEDVSKIGDPRDLATWDWVPTGSDELKSHLFLIVTDRLRAVDMRDARGTVVELSEEDDPTDPMWVRLTCRKVISRSRLELARPDRLAKIAKMFDRNVALFPAEFLRLTRAQFLSCLRDRTTHPKTEAERDLERS